ncbi:molecular chaperone DnaK [Bacillus salitolerans]|uniref:Molecular chaperone DnaK n=1 Tax=Bacillus salitolerans TaxID=1437434 RepID=A0ABW4LLZ2_9BACI
MAYTNMYAELYTELFMMKQELESRLSKEIKHLNQEFSAELLFRHSQDEKKILIQKHIKDDLKDVERALAKMEFGLYGICEETGQRIPIEKLKNLPTARSIHDFNYHELVRI